MDLLQLDSVSVANEGSELTVLHPATQEETDIKIILRGADSDEYRSNTRRRVEQMQRNAKLKNQPDMDVKDLEDKHIELLAGLTLSWTGVQKGEEDVPCTPENVKDIYTNWPWIKEQVNKFVEDRANFIKG